MIDPINVVILLGLKLEELSWDYAKPSQENNDDCLPCLFIQVKRFKALPNLERYMSHYLVVI